MIDALAVDTNLWSFRWRMVDVPRSRPHSVGEAGARVSRSRDPGDSSAPRGILARASRLAPLLALGATLARKGFVPVLSLLITAFTALAAVLVAVAVAKGQPGAPIHHVPTLASSALAWGGGFLLAFAASTRALRRDRTEGIRALLITRTTGLRGYLVARVGGLALLVAIVVGGGTLLCGLVSMAAAARLSAVPRTLHTTLAALAFAIVFSVVVAPVAFAALGARSRVGGYLFFLSVVVAPEILANALSGVLPRAVCDVLSIPSALEALRSALGPGLPGSPGWIDGWRALRALLALAVFASFAVAVVHRDALRVEREEVDA